MIEKKTFKQTVGKLFQKNDFIGKGQSWYLQGEETIVVVNAQKSDYAEKYYLNFGIWLKIIEHGEFPKENHCHIQSRLEVIFPEYQDLIEIGCSLERGSSEDLMTLTGLLQDQVIPFCRNCLNIAEVKRLIQEGRLSKVAVFLTAKDALGL